MTWLILLKLSVLFICSAVGYLCLCLGNVFRGMFAVRRVFVGFVFDNLFECNLTAAVLCVGLVFSPSFLKESHMCTSQHHQHNQWPVLHMSLQP